MTIGISGVIGLIVGVVVAEWLGNPNDAAYYAVVAFGIVVGAAIGKLIAGRSSSSDE